jgi:hypothetical protein
MNEVIVACGADFKSVSGYFIINFLTKMLKDPSNILNTKAPLQIAEDDEIIHS